MEYLVFRLYGPMASWGSIAVGEMRPSNDYPSRSAVMGLVAAALGIRRDEDQRLQQLHDHYQLAIKVIRAGQPLSDYHTAQAPDSAGKAVYQTRRDEIVNGKDRLGTVLSNREYRADAEAIVALTAKANAYWRLQQLQQALLTPKFHLYLGRKAHPLAAPLQPQCLHADYHQEALDNYQRQPLYYSSNAQNPYWQQDDYYLPEDKPIRYYWEGETHDFAKENAAFSAEKIFTNSRRDQPVSRQRWQFQERLEHCWISTPPSTEESL